jgi:hypothetical protein
VSDRGDDDRVDARRHEGLGVGLLVLEIELGVAHEREQPAGERLALDGLHEVGEERAGGVGHDESDGAAAL